MFSFVFKLRLFCAHLGLVLNASTPVESLEAVIDHTTVKYIKDNTRMAGYGQWCVGPRCTQVRSTDRSDDCIFKSLQWMVKIAVK